MLYLDNGDRDFVSLPEQLVGEGDLIVLRVAGESMIDAAITDGDLVVVRRQDDIRDGDIVATRLPGADARGDDAVVTTLRRADGHVWLVPQNPALAPVPGDDATIIGKVVSVVRRL
jgi:repressor LexA